MVTRIVRSDARQFGQLGDNFVRDFGCVVVVFVDDDSLAFSDVLWMTEISGPVKEKTK